MKILKTAMEKQLLNICGHEAVESLEVGSGGDFAGKAHKGLASNAGQMPGFAGAFIPHYNLDD